MLRAAATKVHTTTERGRRNKHEKEYRRCDTRIASHLAPVQGSPQAPAAGFKTKSLLIQAIRLIHKQFNLFTALEHLFNILNHDTLHVFNLTLDSPNIVNTCFRSTGIVKGHAFVQNLTEFFIVRKGDRQQGRIQSVPRDKTVLHILQKRIRDAVLADFVRHAQVANSALDNVVKGVIVIDIGHATILLWDFRQQDASDRGEVACCYNAKQ